MADLSLDELIRQRGISARETNRPVFRRGAGGTGRTFDARQNIGVTDTRQKVDIRGGFPLKDAREKLIQKDARFRLRRGPLAGSVQDARVKINSRKQLLEQSQPSRLPRVQVQNFAGQSSNVVVNCSANESAAPRLTNRVGALQHGGRPSKLVDARDRLSLKRSIAVASPLPGSQSPLKITKTIQLRPVGMASGIRISVPSRDATESVSSEDDVIPSKQVKQAIGCLFSGPITKVVKNDSYTAPRPSVPNAPVRPTPAKPTPRPSPAVLKAVSRTLVTGHTQQGGGTEVTSSQPVAIQPVSSPLEGTKMTVSNLHPRVTEEDIVELFCVCGALKRARLVKGGAAEVVFVRKEDAVAAYRKYNNRCLDGQPMKCNLHIQGSVISSEQPILLRLSDSPGKKEGPSSSRSRPRSSQPTPEVNPQTILKALFKSSNHTATSGHSAKS
ncbi:hypothetical protein GJAV_G00143580 [Gymnothorax javanicus]|nr:hypothetical protein GJAV_G00143580 [Gymnothorax javanicus]